MAELVCVGMYVCVCVCLGRVLLSIGFSLGQFMFNVNYLYTT